MEEIPNSEKVFPADKVIIAAGFLGPEKTLAEQFGIKKVSLKCFYKFDFLICFFSSSTFLWIFVCRIPEAILPPKRTSF